MFGMEGLLYNCIAGEDKTFTGKVMA